MYTLQSVGFFIKKLPICVLTISTTALPVVGSVTTVPPSSFASRSTVPDASFSSALPLPAFTPESVPVIEARPPHERVPENSAEASAALCSLIFEVEEPQPMSPQSKSAERERRGSGAQKV